MGSAIKPLIDVSGMICQVDTENGISHAVCRIRYIERDTGEFKYVFTPNYSEIEQLGEENFDGIQGLDLSRRQKTYTRTNRTPVFISERVPASNREDVRQLFVQDGMEGRSKLEWLMNTQTTYSGDRLIVRSLLSEEQKHGGIFVNTNIESNVFFHDDDNKKSLIGEKAGRGSELVRFQEQRRGRPTKAIDPALWKKVSKRYMGGEINAREAAGMLEMSESTFFRKLRGGAFSSEEDGGIVPGKPKGRYANRTDASWSSNTLSARFEAARAEIDKLDGAEFQRLCTRFVGDRYGLRGFTNIGMKAGAHSTVKGTPDAFWEYPDGSFLAMEAGHYGSSKSAAKNKIVSDIQKCLDYENANLTAGSISNIVICYSNGLLGMKERQEIRKRFFGRDIDLIGPDVLAKAVTEDYPWIGREMLNIAYKSHAVMSVQDFIDLHDESSYRAPLSFGLVGREQEMKRIRELLNENQVVILEGDSGAGKTRLALEVIQEYGRELCTTPIVVQATKEDISEELMLCCRRGQERILLVDDANELSRLSFFPGFLRENENIKIIATVRSYASEAVKREFRDSRMVCHRLDRLEGKKLDQALEESFEIASPVLRKELVDQSHGNLRLAYFIKRAYAEGIPEGTGFGDIVKECYSIATEWLSENEKNAIRVSSILGAHRTFDNDDLDMLLGFVGMSLQTYTQACGRLCERELMDSVQGVKAVSFEEQNLRDYFIYEALVGSQVFSFEAIWSLSRGERLLLNCVNVLLQVFPGDETVDFIKRQLSIVWDRAKPEQRKDLVKKYHRLLGPKGLRFLISQAESMPSLDQDLLAFRHVLTQRVGSCDTWILEPLSRYAQDSSYRDLVLDTIIALIKNDALSAADTKWTLTEGLRLIRPSGRVSYDYELKLFDRFLDAYINARNETLALCLVLLARKALKDEIEWTDIDDDKSFTLWTTTLEAEHEVVEYRRHVLETLRDLCAQTTLRSEIITVVFGYSASRRACSNDLFAVTGKMIVDLFAEFVSVDELHSLESVAMFRHHCLSCGLGNLAERLLEEIGTSVTAEFILSLIEEGERTGEQYEYGHSVEISKRFTKDDWREVVDTFSAEGLHSKLGSYLHEFVRQRIACEQDQDFVDALCDLMLSSGAYPYGRNEFCESLLRRHGAEKGRRRILKTSGNYLATWLQSYDEYCIVEGHVLPNANDYVRGWKDYAEILPLEEILKVEAKHEGFLSQYLNELKDGDRVSRFMLRLVLPHDEKARNGLKPFMEETEVLGTMKVLALRYFEASNWVDEGIALYLFECDRTFIVDLMSIDVRIREENALEQLASKFWLDHTAEELKVIGSFVEDASHDFKNYYSCREWLKLFFSAAFECEKPEEALAWLRSLDCGICSDYGMWAEIVCSLDDDSKIECITSVCEEGIDRDLFTYIAFSMSFEGKSWSGSESSIVMQDAAFAKRLREALRDKGLYKYVLDCDDYIEYCKKKIQDIEIEDFINDW